jgi:hypothetical protein
MRVASDLNPEALRQPQTKDKVCSDKEFMDRYIGPDPIARRDIVAKAERDGISPRTPDRYLQQLAKLGIIFCGAALYWRREP